MKEELAYSIIRVGTIGLVFHLEKNKQKESLPTTIKGKKKVVLIQIPRSHVGPTVT